MKLTYVRTGHQANSSSDHRILFDPSLEFAFATDDELTKVTSGLVVSGYWGREWYKLTNNKDKADYLFVNLWHTVRGALGWDGDKFVEEINKRYGSTAVLVDSWRGTNEVEAFVDHQSGIGIPLNFDRTDVDWDFFDYMLRLFVANEHVTIFTGNDEEPPPDGFYPYGWERYSHRLVTEALAKKEEKNE